VRCPPCKPPPPPSNVCQYARILATKYWTGFLPFTPIGGWYLFAPDGTWGTVPANFSPGDRASGGQYFGALPYQHVYTCTNPTTPGAGPPWLNTQCWGLSSAGPNEDGAIIPSVSKRFLTCKVKLLADITMPDGTHLYPAGSDSVSFDKNAEQTYHSDRRSDTDAPNPVAQIQWPVYTPTPIPGLTPVVSAGDTILPQYPGLPRGDTLGVCHVQSETATESDFTATFNPVLLTWAIVDWFIGQTAVLYQEITATAIMTARVTLSNPYTQEECQGDCQAMLDMADMPPWGTQTALSYQDGQVVAATGSSVPNSSQGATLPLTGASTASRLKVQCTGPWCLYFNDGQNTTCSQQQDGDAVTLSAPPGVVQTAQGNCRCAP